MSSSSEMLTPVGEEHASYAYIEYFLRLSLHASTAKVLSLWELSNPQLSLQFEKRCKDVLTVDSWIDLGALQAPNLEEEVLRRGFLFPASSPSASTDKVAGGNALSTGKFAVGKLALSNDNAQDGKIVKRLLLCKVAIGRAYCAAEEFARVAPVPDGYDSFFLDTNNGEVDKGNADVCEYVVKDGAQVLPTFVVTVEFDAAMEARSRQTQTCDNCERNEATVYCAADDANLCGECDGAMHATKLASRHVRLPLDVSQAISHCRMHGDKVVEFFCPTCSKPVCVHCKMVGHHSAGEASKHKLITVQEAYKGVMESSKAVDPLMQARKQAIRTQLQSLQERAKQVEANAADVHTQLEELFRKASADLKALTRRKLNVLRGDVCELRRQEQEIGRLEGFLAYCADSKNATQFILDWAHHQRLRSQQHAFAFFRDAIDVLPDIRIHGHIQVHIDGTNNSSSNNNNNTAGMMTEERTPRYSSPASPSRSHLSRPSISKRADFLSEAREHQGSMLSVSNGPASTYHHLGSKLDVEKN